MMIRVLSKLLLPCLLCGLLTACATSPLKATDKLALPPPSAAWKNISAITKKGQPLWLITSETTGLSLIDSSNNRLLALQGHFELLDVRPAHDNEFWALTVDSQSNAPQLLLMQTHPEIRLRERHTLFNGDFQIDGLCLYKDAQSHLMAYFLDGNGSGELRWLVDGSSGKVVDTSITMLNLPPNSEHCTVHDASNSLFISEAEIGIWRYPANPEIENSRILVDRTFDGGKIDGEVMHLTTTRNALYAATEQRLNIYSPAQWQLQSSVPFPPGVTVEGIAASQSQLAVLDEAQQALTLMPLSQPTSYRSSEKHILPVVKANAQTTAMDRRGDAADDPAIWIHPQEPEKSLILGTNKKWGLLVYNLQGEAVRSIATGHINNVDVRQNLLFANEPIDIAVASNRSNNAIALYKIHPETGDVNSWASLPTDLNDVYGICLFTPTPSDIYIIINDKSGRVNQYKLGSRNRKPHATLTHSVQLKSQPEGCVADDTRRELFIGEEDKGVWRFNLTNDKLVEPELIATTNGHLVADVEGIDIVKNEFGNYLVVSSQGDHSYAVFENKAPYEFLGKFRIAPNATLKIDGTSETDGLAVTGMPLGNNYPAGLMVVQDGHNLMPNAPQNFKLISWKDVLNALKIPTVE